MKITSVDVISLAYQKGTDQLPVLCRINTDEGIFGYGEAGVSIASFTAGSYELIKLFAPKIIGMDPLDHETIWYKLFTTFWGRGGGGVVMSAISAIDMALWDIKGKFFNVPVYKLLGGKQREKIHCYASQLHGGWKDPDFMGRRGELYLLQEACEAAMADGYDAVKVNCISKSPDGRPVAGIEYHNYIPRDLMQLMTERVALVRKTCGDQATVILENHCRTGAMTAVEFARAAEPYDILFMEEAASPLSPEEFARIAAGTSIPLATGERIYSRWNFLPFLQNGSISVLQPDIGNCGGITECMKICALAEVYGVKVQTHTCNTPLSVAASLHVEAAIPNFIIHEHHTCNTLPVVTETCEIDYQPKNGWFEIPELPGLGNEPSKKALAEAVIETVTA